MDTDYRLLGQEPVSEGEPWGKDIRYEDGFSELQSEIDKLASPGLRDSFKWETVAGLASRILKEQSKDLLVGSYLSAALVHMNGARGLETGSLIIRDLITTYWESLYPSKKRMKGRTAALAWWVEKTEAALDSGKAWGLDSETRNLIIGHMKATDDFLITRTTDFSLLPLVRKVEKLIPEDRPHKNNAIRQAPEQAGPGPSEPVDMTMVSADELMKSLIPVFQKIKQSSKIVNDDKDDNPQAYRWLRFSIWESLTTLPDAKDKVTRIPPPDPRILSRIESLCRAEDWKGLVLSSESALYSSRNLFALDLNRYSFEALSKLGGKYQNAGNVVAAETFHFANRMGGVEHLMFSDKTPFADDKTKEWLNSLRNDGARDTSPPILKNTADMFVVEDDITRIRERLKKGARLSDVVALFQDRIRSGTSEKEILRLRTELAAVLGEAKQGKMAAVQMELVLDTVNRHRLGTWDPDFAFDTLKRVYRTVKSYPDVRGVIKADNILSELAKINMVEAMKL